MNGCSKECWYEVAQSACKNLAKLFIRLEHTFMYISASFFIIATHHHINARFFFLFSDILFILLHFPQRPIFPFSSHTFRIHINMGFILLPHPPSPRQPLPNILPFHHEIIFLQHFASSFLLLLLVMEPKRRWWKNVKIIFSFGFCWWFHCSSPCYIYKQQQ